MLSKRRLFILSLLTAFPAGLWLLGQPIEALAVAVFYLAAYWLWQDLKPVRTTHGSARWATLAELKVKDLFNPAGVIIGSLGAVHWRLFGLTLYRKAGQLLRLGGNSHLLTVAPTRSGKGVGQIIPTLLEYEGSAFVLDVKGENYAITGEARRDMGQRVVALKPSDLTISDCLNPLDVVRRDTVENLAEDVGILASLLVPVQGEGAERHFSEQGNTLIQALLFRTLSEPRHLQTLGTLREDLTRSPDDLKALLEAIVEEAQKNEREENEARAAGREVPSFLNEKGAARLSAVAADAASSAAGITGDEWSGVMSTAKGATKIFAYPQVQGMTRQSTFTFAELKRRPTTVYLIIEPNQLDFYKQLMRVMVGLCVQSMVTTADKPPLPVLFLLDEFPKLGYMANIEEGISILAGYSVRFWVFVQNLSQIKHIYRDNWETLTGNCKVQSYFGITDDFTAEQLSKRLGNKTVQSRAASVSGSAANVVAVGSSENLNESETGRALLTPDEITALDERKQIMTISGMRPVLAGKVLYYDDERFKHKAGKWRG